MEIDNKWLDFLMNKNKNNHNDDDNDDNNYCDDDDDNGNNNNFKKLISTQENKENLKIDENTVNNSTELYISTKSKLAYFNEPLDLKKMFWDIEVSSYNTRKNCVIKKQIKYNCQNEEELSFLQDKLKTYEYYDQKILKNISNPTGRVKFKDIRKVSIGLSTKDILTFRSKEKGAFYNCLVLIIRYKINENYKEFHTKFFNTGKLEIPGIQDDNVYNEILDFILNLVRSFTNKNLFYSKVNEIVLINSDFNCGFYIDQETLYGILKYKYNIQCIYDPCSYPGLQCKFYYNYISENMSGHQINNMTIKENKKSNDDVIISFMIFRTGSVLISGKCDENIIYKVYNFIKDMLFKEYSKIFIKINHNIKDKNKNKKIRKKTIFVKN